MLAYNLRIDDLFRQALIIRDMASISQFDENCYNIFLEELLNIFKSRSHPFVLLDNLAMCWMGSSNLPNNVSPALHYLFRNSYLPQVYHCASGVPLTFLLGILYLSTAISTRRHRRRPTSNWKLGEARDRGHE